MEQRCAPKKILAKTKLFATPGRSAQSAGLKYVSDQKPGIRRVRAGGGFLYHRPNGGVLRDPAALKRIAALAIPPAWTEVWICPDPRGHLQAVGRDARRRKQYRYHARWREARDELKYHRMIAFGLALPKIRRRVNRDIRRRGVPREKVLAAVVRLLELTALRVGNEEYASQNKSFGLTTIQNRHVRVRGRSITFDFRGKSGKRQHVDIEHPVLSRIVRKCQDLPGQHLFEYVDHDGRIRCVTSEDVNEYLASITRDCFTAKDFRTWTGTVLAALALREFEAVKSRAGAKRNIVRAIEQVAERLGNTPAVCKKCYIHPVIFESYLDGALRASLGRNVARELGLATNGLRPEEAAVIDLLQHPRANGTQVS